ncbi:very large low complexity [Cryptosporidium sp. chipmunk genotype I]|uniref:very large low complexity n=1 Tax=Cryptosporidium sp. chipmunk genotype I TaxID=1280935 RepID=UPI00351AB072|nr:very large low complexity [Cryptosporidium sp. chipmunk genotype I]
MSPIWTKPDFLELTIGANWRVPSNVLGCDGGSWYSISNSAKFYLRVLEKLQNEYLSMSNASGVTTDLENLRLCLNRIRNSVSYISEEFPWSRLKYMYEKAVLRRSTLDFKELHRFIVDTISKVKSLENEHSIILPGIISLEDSKKPIFLLYVVSRNDNQYSSGFETFKGSSSLYQSNNNPRYSFSVINVSGFGTEYHLYTNSLMSNNPTSLMRDSVLVISDIYTERLIHSAFWISLYRLSFVPSKNNMHYLYTVLLPFLNEKNLYDNWVTKDHFNSSNKLGIGNIWIPNPRRKEFGSSSKLVQSALQLLFQSYSISIFKGVKPEQKAAQFQLFLNWSILRLLEEDFSNCIKNSDSISFVNACTVISAFIKAFAYEISNYSFSLSIPDHHPILEKKTDTLIMSSNTGNSIPFYEWYQHLCRFKANFEKIFPCSLFGFGMGSCTLSSNIVSNPITRIALYSTFANFGQFRLDGPNIMILAGESNEPNIDIPIELDSIDRKITCIEDVINVLETCISVCVLLTTQSESAKNSHLIKFKLIQHVFQDLIPIPLPWTHPQKKERCFWSFCQPQLLRSQQVRILELLNSSMRHFLASSFSIGFNHKIPQFDRLIVAGAISSIADNIARSFPFDFKSPLSIHLTGRHQGPKNWFYVDLINFQEITDFGVYTDPSTVTVRSMVLDYFHSTHYYNSDENLRLVPVFSFEDKPGTLDEGTLELLMQISTEFGFPSHLSLVKEDQRKMKTFSIPLFFTGETREMMDIVPEFYSLRDIFFYLKFVITLSFENHPETLNWNPASSFLLWSYNSAKDSYQVRGFDKNLECNYIPTKSLDTKQHKGLWSSFTGWLTSSGDKNHLKSFSKLADPGTIINSFDALEGAPGESLIALNCNSSSNSSTQGLPSSGSRTGPGTAFNLSPGSGPIADLGPGSASVVGQGFTASPGSAFTVNPGLGSGYGSSENSSSSSNSSSSLGSSVSVGDESDILYLKSLPGLSDQLLPSEVERVLQYLTTPYLRIPLLLQFFSDENRINSLSSVSVQHIIWMSILEPWQWSPINSSNRGESHTEPSQPVVMVPVEDVKEISTCSGLLFNELLRSPSTLFKALEELMLMALDKDTGSFSGANSKIILFVLRISIVISNYTNYLIRYHENWKRTGLGKVLGMNCGGSEKKTDKDSMIGPMVNGVFRGFEILFKDEKLINLLKQSYTRLRYLIENLYLSMIVDWMRKALKELNIPTLCVLYAHIASIYGQVFNVDDLDIHSVTFLLSSLVFLTTHYSVEDGSSGGRSVRKSSSSNSSSTSSSFSSSSSAFSSSMHQSEKRISSFYIRNPWGYTLNNVLGVPDLDIFTIQARTRSIIINWLSNNVREANLVLDTVVNAVAMKGIGEIDGSSLDLENDHGDKGLTGGPSTREWIQIPSISGGGRFVPLSEIPTDLYDWLSCDDVDFVKSKLSSRLGSRNTSFSSSSYRSLNWWRLKKKFSRALQSRSQRGGVGSRSDDGQKETSGSFMDGLGGLGGGSFSQSRYLSTRLEYNEWFRTVLSINTETEINVQFSLFSLKNNNLRVLGSWIHDFEDFADVIRESDDFHEEEGRGFSNGRLLGNQFQSADIANTENLYWCKLIGSRIDLYKWEPFHKTNQVTFKTRYSRSNLPKGAEWIVDIFEPWRAIFLGGVSTIYIDDGNSGSSSANKIFGSFGSHEEMIVGGSDGKKIVSYKPPDLSNVVRMQFLYPLYEPGEGPESPNQKVSMSNSMVSRSEFENGRRRRVSGDDKGEDEYRENEEEDIDSQNAEIVTHSLKEIVIQRFPPVILVFDIVEQGRLYYKQLCHTSNISYSLGSLDNSKFISPFLSTRDFCCDRSGVNSVGLGELGEAGGGGAGASGKFLRLDSNMDGRFSLASGIPLSRGRKPSKSLVIMRDYYKEPVGTEMYIPSRFLLGLIPQVFLETHEFWQSQSTGNIRGYPRKSALKSSKIERKKPGLEEGSNSTIELGISTQRDLKTRRQSCLNKGDKPEVQDHDLTQNRNQTHSQTQDQDRKLNDEVRIHDEDLYLLDIFVFPCSDPAQRYGLIGDGVSLIQRRYIQNPSNVQTLINLQTLYGSSGEFHSLFNTLQRLDDVSHTLLWSNDNPVDSSGGFGGGGGFSRGNLSIELSLDQIEFPRLHLSFVRRERDRSNTLLTMPTNMRSSSGFSSGQVRYVCEQHSGLYLSWRNIFDYPLTCELLRGLPHSVLLENDDGDFFILVPATAKPILIPPIGLGGGEGGTGGGGGLGTGNSYGSSSNSSIQANEQGMFERFSSTIGNSNESLSSLLYSSTSILSENIESITTAPGQYLVSMASVASQNLFHTAVSTLANTTKNIVDGTINKAGEVIVGGLGGAGLGGAGGDGGGVSSLLFKGTYIMDRGDKVWISKLGPTKHYLYPVHTSKSFVFINSVVSGLYLMLWRFLEQQFESVLSVLDIATSSDMESSVSMEGEWSSEEKQLWQVFNSLGHAWDCHPDAHACRLKIWLYCLRHFSASTSVSASLLLSRTKTITTKSSLGPDEFFSTTWDLYPDIQGYVTKLASISANCRLSLEEELEVLQAFPHFVKDSPELNNRLNLVTSALEKGKRLSSSSSSSKILPEEGAGRHIKDLGDLEMIEFQLFNPQTPQIDDFDSWMDISCIGVSEYGGVSNINNPVSSLWENLSNTLGTLNLPPVVNSNNSSNANSSGNGYYMDYGLDKARRSAFLSDGLQQMISGYKSDRGGVVSGEDATEFLIKFLGRSTISKMISNAVSATVSGISSGVAAAVAAVTTTSTATNSAGSTNSTSGFTLDIPFIQDTSSNTLGVAVGIGTGTPVVYLSDWIFIYELLTGHFPLEVLPGESTHVWGVLFARSLPAWDWKSPSILVSILRLLMLNPALALSSRMPRFSEQVKKNKLQIGTVLKSQECFQTLVKDASLILCQEYRTGSLVTHSKYYSKSTSNASKNSLSTFFSSLFAPSVRNVSQQKNSIKAWAISPESRISRWSVSLRRGNYNCEERKLGCIGVSGSCQISKQDLLCYSRSPILAAQNMDKFLIPLQKEPRNSGNKAGEVEDPIYDLPGMLFSHPISKTTIGKSSLERYRNDIREYSSMISKRLDFSILGLDYTRLFSAFCQYHGLFTETGVKSEKEKDSKVRWEDIRKGIMDLRMLLLQLYFKDGQFIDSAISRLDEIANGQAGRKSVCQEKINKSDKEWFLYWYSSFGKLCGKEPILRFDFLVSQLMSSSSQADIKKLSLFVDDEDIQVIHSLTAATMMTVNRRSQVSNALIQLRDIICFLSTIQDELRLREGGGISGQKNQNHWNSNSSITALGKDFKWLERNLISLEMKLRNVARVLSSRRHYVRLLDIRNGSEIVTREDLEKSRTEDVLAIYDPRFLVFEFAYSILLRKDQVELIHKLYNSATKGRSICHQMIMGAGKTTVISPLLSLLLGDSQRLVIQIVPPALLEFTRDVLRSRFSCIVKKRILKFQFNRNSICTPELYRKLVHAKEQKAIILCHPTSVKSLFLKTVFLFRILRYWNNDITSSSGLKMALKYISLSANINKNKLVELFDKGGSSIKQILKIGSSEQVNHINKVTSSSSRGRGGLGGGGGGGRRRREIRNSRSKEISSKLVNDVLNNEDKEELYLQYKKELDLCLRILHIFKHESVVIVDEIDMILHPLKSELHWPIGEKIPLDLSGDLHPPILTDDTFEGGSECFGSRQSQDHDFNDNSEYCSSSFALDSTGMRWLIPWYLIEALLTKPNQINLLSNSQMLKSGSVVNLLVKIQSKIESGISKRSVQSNPHLVLLDEEYYEREIRPLLIRWIIFVIRLHKFSGLSDELCELYLNTRGSLRAGSGVEMGALGTEAPEPKGAQENTKDLKISSLISKLDHLDDFSMKLLNLSKDWINEYLPHVFQLVHRVSYGLIDESTSGISRRDWLGQRFPDLGTMGVERAKTVAEQTPPLSRHLLSIPFIGKDTPSVASEFSHPDVVIGLTILAYRYNGLRRNDIYHLLDYQKRSCQGGFGQLKDRPSVLEFNKWVKLSGGRVRGTKRDKLKNIISTLHCLNPKNSQILDHQKKHLGADFINNLENHSEENTIQTNKKFSKITNPLQSGTKSSQIDQICLLWPLDVINLQDHEQLEQLYELLRFQPLAIKAFLGRQVFPELLEYSEKQLSASGQEIGGEMLFSTRLGFSGTPSELLPVELGKCEYEKGSDGEMIHYLTNGAIISSIEILDVDWTVKDFLLDICSTCRDKEVHALIDSGAFITGLSNVQVAEFLLRNGLKDIDAVVFIDDRDKQMIMLRDGFRIIEISQCGVSLERRFAFYDHVHSIGQDIKHTPLAKAILTVSKDMVFRDFAQGAYRMRQLGQGQTIHIVLQAQVADLIERNALVCRMISERDLFTKSRDKSFFSGNNNDRNEDLISFRGGNFEIPNPLLFLRCLCGWLLIQSITKEFEQSQLLCVQSLENIWRKKSFRRMINEHVQWEDCNSNKGEDKLVDVFVEKLSFEISSTVPFNVPVKDQLRNKLLDNRDLILENKGFGSSNFNIVEGGIAREKGGAGGSVEGLEIRLAERLLGQLEEMNLYKGHQIDKVRGEGLDREMEKELEMEMEIYQERELQQEKEQEKQQEKQQETENANLTLKWAKPSLDVSRDFWPFEALLAGNSMLSLGVGAGIGAGAGTKETPSSSSGNNSNTGRRKIEELAPFAFFMTSKGSGGGIHRQTSTNACPSLEKIFLPLSKYCVMNSNTTNSNASGINCIDFPNHLRFTTNLYNPSIARNYSNNSNFQQRLNNFNIIIECENGKSPDNNHLPRDYFFQLKEAFAVFDGDSTGKINLDDIPDLIKTLNWVENVNLFEREILKCLRFKVKSKVKYQNDFTLSQNRKDKTIKTVNNLLSVENELSDGNNTNTNNTNNQISVEKDDLLDFINNHPWENSSINMVEKNGQIVEMDSSELILENSYLQEEEKKINIDFEELYQVMNSVLNTSSNKCYIAVTLEEAQSIRWIIHRICSDTDAGETLRKTLNLNSNSQFFSIKIYHLSNTLILLDEINNDMISSFSSSPPFQLDDHNSNGNNLNNIPIDFLQKLNQENDIEKINLLELQAQSIYKFVNSESNFTKQEISTAVRTLQNTHCKLRKDFYLNIKKCRRRNKKENETNSLENNHLLLIIFTTPNESAILQCRGLASRLSSKLDKFNMTILDLFKLLDKNQTGAISSVHLYASLESLQIAPNPLDYLRIIHFVFGNNQPDTANDLNYLHHISISQESFMKAFYTHKNFSSNSSMNSTGLPPLPKIDDSMIAQAENKLKNNMNIYKDSYNDGFGGFGRGLSGLGIQYFDPIFLSKLKCKFNLHSNFHKVFEIPGVITIWNPDQLEGKYRGVMKKNRERICFGQYGSGNYDLTMNNNNSSNSISGNFQSQILEIIDNNSSSMSESSELKKFVNIVFPHPKKFKPIFRGSLLIPNTNMETGIFTIWKPIPPSNQFATLGILVTKGDEIPSINTIRCIPIHWCKIVNYRSLPCIGSLQQKPKTGQIISENKTFQTIIHPVSFCLTSNLQILGAVVNLKSHAYSEHTNISGSFVNKDQFLQIYNKLYIPADEKIVNFLNYREILDRNVLFSRLFWLDIAYSDIAFHYINTNNFEDKKITEGNEQMSSIPQVINCSYLIPQICNKKNCASNHNPISLFGM